MCSDPLDPDGEVRGCAVGCTILGVWDIAPLVLIITAGRYIGFYKELKNVSCEYIGFLEIKKMLFQAGVL